jgi:hypothetical protein
MLSGNPRERSPQSGHAVHRAALTIAMVVIMCCPLCSVLLSQVNLGLGFSVSHELSGNIDFKALRSKRQTSD